MRDAYYIIRTKRVSMRCLKDSVVRSSCYVRDDAFRASPEASHITEPQPFEYLLYVHTISEE